VAQDNARRIAAKCPLHAACSVFFSPIGLLACARKAMRTQCLRKCQTMALFGGTRKSIDVSSSATWHFWQ
jgi:hypothetical protein